MNSNFKFKIKNYLERLQNLPDKQKKIVLWAIVAILAIIMGYFWIKGAINNFQKIGENVSRIKFPEIQTPATVKKGIESPCELAIDTVKTKEILFPDLNKTVIFSNPFQAPDEVMGGLTTYWATISIKNGSENNIIVDNFEFKDKNGIPTNGFRFSTECDGKNLNLYEDWNFGGWDIFNEVGEKIGHQNQRESPRTLNVETEEYGYN